MGRVGVRAVTRSAIPDALALSPSPSPNEVMPCSSMTSPTYWWTCQTRIFRQAPSAPSSTSSKDRTALYEVEFADSNGKTLATAALADDQVRVRR